MVHCRCFIVFLVVNTYTISLEVYFPKKGKTAISQTTEKTAILTRFLSKEKGRYIGLILCRFANSHIMWANNHRLTQKLRDF